MPKTQPKLLIDLNLLKPQSEQQKILFRLLQWVLSSGRFLIILVEIIVLGAFLLRFKLDADIISTKEEIDQQIPYIESLKTDEGSIRKFQSQLATIKEVKQNSSNFALILKKIANQTPSGVKISSLNIERQIGKVNLKITGVALTNTDLLSFLNGLKEDKNFTEVNLASISLEQGLINFSLTSQVIIGGPKL